MRKIIYGTYDTAFNLWTLTEWGLTPAEVITNYVDVPGRISGPLDLSTALTDGEPRFGSRTLSATFETSEGTRLERKARIDTMVNWLAGWSMNITLPDDDSHYLVGRVTVEPLYNDMAHAAVEVTAVCEPWLYSVAETVVSLTAAADEQTKLLTNNGRKTVVPLLEVTGTDASVNLAFGQASWALGPGTYKLPDLVLPQGDHLLTYSGTGDIKLSYRKAVLS